MLDEDRNLIEILRLAATAGRALDCEYVTVSTKALLAAIKVIDIFEEAS